MKRLAVALAVAVGALGLTGCLPSGPGWRTYTYSIVTDGPVRADLWEFKLAVGTTFNSEYGWHQAGLNFIEVPEGGDFTVVLAHPDEVPKYSPGTCDDVYSCQSGRYVVINEARWVFGSGAWPGPLAAYRVMVINHELGHWLGLGHTNCPAPGAQAPIMQQQSISMQGCVLNSWPLPWELDLAR